jgi:hypothetical protein|tara:strand:+ start:802 stop:1119 length:318 start_codon:yes stop_codon:yes gene_type:complete
MTDETESKPNYYTPAVKKAVYKYREANRESYNNYLRAYQREMMNDPVKAARKKDATRRSNEKVRLRRIADRDALMDKINIVKTELSSVAEKDLQSIIITANNVVL